MSPLSPSHAVNNNKNNDNIFFSNHKYRYSFSILKFRAGCSNKVTVIFIETSWRLNDTL